MAGVRRLITVAAVVVGLALPVYAQRGGGGHGGGSPAGHSSGFVAHGSGFGGSSFVGRGAPSFRSALPPIGRVNFMGAPQFATSRYSAVPYLRSGRSAVAGYPGHSGYPQRGSGRRDDDRYRRPYLPAYGYAFPSGFSIWPGSLLDSDLYDDSGFYDNPGYYDNSAYANPAPPADYGSQPYPAPPIEQAEVATPGSYRPAFERPQPEPEPESVVTLVFKDGRPNEQIHNYMLTRTTLYIQDGHRSEIPIADLDLAATQKINKDAGVDFQLPGTGR